MSGLIRGYVLGALCVYLVVLQGSCFFHDASDNRSLQRKLRPRQYFVEKSTFSDSSRAIFVAGLEGTGHHLFRTLADRCDGVNEGKKKKKNKKKRNAAAEEADATSSMDPFHDRCVVDKDAMCLLYNNTPKSDHPHDTLFNAQGSLSAYQGQRTRYTQSLRSLMRKAQISFLNVDLRKTPPKNCVSGMMSYPNFGGPLKVLQHPNIHLLAELAEKAGVDLRIIVMLREPLALLASTVLKRHFVESAEVGMEVLLRNFEILVQQLLMLDPAYFHCMDFDELPKLESTFESRQWMGDEQELGKFAVPASLANIYNIEHELEALYREPSPSNASAEMQQLIDDSPALQAQYKYFLKLHKALKKICSA